MDIPKVPMLNLGFFIFTKFSYQMVQYNERQHKISNNVVWHTHSLIRAFASRLNILWL